MTISHIKNTSSVVKPKHLCTCSSAINLHMNLRTVFYRQHKLSDIGIVTLILPTSPFVLG